jgi:hypothetical protein
MKRSLVLNKISELIAAKGDLLTPEDILSLLESMELLPQNSIGTNWRGRWQNED